MVPIPEGVERSEEEPDEDLQNDPQGWGRDAGVYGSGYNIQYKTCVDMNGYGPSDVKSELGN